MERTMASPEQEQEFPSFPYPPYGIQLGFMRALYSALDKGGVGLFESPTGTGKTLSLICGSLTWLSDVREREKQEVAAAAAAAEAQQVGAGEEDIPAWMRDFAANQDAERRKQEEEERAKRIAKAKARLVSKTVPLKAAADKNAADDPDSEFLLEEVEEGGAGEGTGGNKKRFDNPWSDSDDEEDALPLLGEAEEAPAPCKTQIIFCSRTHSQLSQFVGELHRTPFADSMSLVALGSRRALCINDDVTRLRAPGLINERCLELQKPASARKKAAVVAEGGKRGSRRASTAAGKCPFLASGTKAADTTRDMILAQPIDIEALAALGRRRSVCPYYASRRATPEADVILAPYSALLVADTREALGLRVEGNVIIIDEAHNLADAINGAHSADLSASTAAAAHRQLSAYFARFGAQLAPANARNVQSLMRTAQALAKVAGSSTAASASVSASASASASATTVNDFLFSTGLDNVNMFQLVRNVKASKAVFKVAGFWQAAQRRAAAEGDTPATDASNSNGTEGATGALHSLLFFLQALTNEDADGRVVVDPGASTVKFVLLNAAAHFAAVVSAAKAVVLASGTLSPLDSVMQLFPGVPQDAVSSFSCGHVVGEERLLALAVGAGPSGAALDFRHASRSTPATVDELGRLVSNVCSAAPGGVVVFLPSFSYADQVFARWGSTGMLSTLGSKKKVYREPRAAGDVESTLEEYAESIASSHGALLLCVVGGKLAEGINFGDALGRCVIMVGLPYPNPSDPELQERLKFIDRASGSAGGSSASREHYSNLCMKAVNQCVGRAIRHRQDYAAVVLVDVRYAAGASGSITNGGGKQQQLTGPMAKLPGWIQQCVVACPKFGEAYSKLVRFYKAMAAASVLGEEQSETNK